VFAGEHGLPLDGDALSSRYQRALAVAGLRRLRFHDLRHTFGTRMIAKADIRRVQEWMGHADIQTTMTDDDEVPALRAAGGGCAAGDERFCAGGW
jgi:integrase